MKKIALHLIPFFVLSLLSGFSSAEPNIIRLATTTSTYNSGLLDNLLPVFEKQTNTRVQVIAVGTGKALQMGRQGDVDLVMTHAPGAEAKFVNEGYGVTPKSLMYNDFVVVGPANDPAGIKGLGDVTSAFKKIADANAPFVSRGDDSGTHKKERNLWQAAGMAPEFERYMEVGQGMGQVLQMADELQGYALTDRGTWLAYQSKLQLKLLVAGDERLFNPYQVILVNPSKHTGLNTTDATTLQRWLVSVEGQKMINNYKVNGEQLFYGSAE
jgi:tungstate transport system substrate-binding protein